mmetsp:Transcript_25436/g.55229  ORF Transcript_25436/g.55229 Transcript_25436/m.55229 type:complete len:207 (+) Transcript_25436:138-758(+)
MAFDCESILVVDICGGVRYAKEHVERVIVNRFVKVTSYGDWEFSVSRANKSSGSREVFDAYFEDSGSTLYPIPVPMGSQYVPDVMEWFSLKWYTADPDARSPCYSSRRASLDVARSSRNTNDGDDDDDDSDGDATPGTLHGHGDAEDFTKDLEQEGMTAEAALESIFGEDWPGPLANCMVLLDDGNTKVMTAEGAKHFYYFRYDTS